MFIFFTILLIAIGLSMDTFSLSISYGLFIKTKKEILKISTCVGIFHFIMPLLGNLLGERIISFFLLKDSLIIGIIFLIISIELIISLIKNEEIKSLTNNKEILLFAFTVSIDSFSTGIGLGALKTNLILISVIFFITSYIFTCVGLTFGKNLKKVLGRKSELIGVIILLILSIKYLFF